MHLKVLGLNFKTTPVEIREKFSVSKDEIKNRLENLDEYEGLDEAVVLSTCNRFEIYAVADNPYENSLKKFMDDLTGIEIDSGLYEYENRECIKHLFEVAASLDSLVLGEGQILSQVKEAYRIAKSVEATHTVLNTLFNRAVASGKLVRTETGIALKSVSVSSAAVELAAKNLNGLENKNALIFGAGKMALLVAQHLKSHGVKKIFVANHHIERAVDMANKIDGEAVSWENALKSADNVEVVVTSTGAPHYVVKPEPVRELMKRREGREIFFIDIAVPRDVDPEVGKIPGVNLCNIDDLETVVDLHKQARREEAESAKKIVAEEVEAVVERFKYLKFRPIMADLSDRAEKIREREVRRFSGKMHDLTDEDKKVIDNMTKMIVRKLLRLPMMKLNSSAGTREADFYAGAMRALFTEDDEKIAL